MEYRDPLGHAFRKNGPFKARCGGPFQRGFLLLLRVKQIAASHQFRQNHRHGLKGFFFFLHIMTLGLILNHQNANHFAGPQNGNPHQGVINLLAGFSTVNKFRMCSGIGQVKRHGRLRNMTDKTFADPQAGIVNRAFFQPFGGKKFQYFTAAYEIYRTYFGNHIAGHKAYDFGQALLGTARTRHYSMQSSKKLTRRTTNRSH